jgi:hypothetical protein
MTISKDDAAAALRDIDQAGERSLELKSYDTGGPYLLIWGLAWLVAGSVTDFMPRQGALIWNTVNAIAVIATIWLTYRLARQNANRRGSWRVFLAAFILAVFANTVLWLFQPLAANKIMAFVGLLNATGYALLGLWQGPRWIIAGGIVALALLVGFYYVPEHYSLWMGVVGGGSMIISGVWIRRA